MLQLLSRSFPRLLLSIVTCIHFQFFITTSPAFRVTGDLNPISKLSASQGHIEKDKQPINTYINSHLFIWKGSQARRILGKFEDRLEELPIQL